MSSHHQRQSVPSIHNKKFWTEFFYLYESLPALWDVNNPVYKNRQVKCDAYDIMVDKLRELEPTADREDVLRKINIFRTNYRRECSRINLSLQEGRHYKSTLWYFDLLQFLQTADTRRVRKRKLIDAGMEKSIMGKRRTSNGISKNSDIILVATKKGDIIEYLPQSANGTDIDYDNYDESDYDYVVEDLSQTLGEPKSERALQIPIDGDYQDLDADDANSQNGYDREFQNFAMQTNDATKSMEMSSSQKNPNLATENVGLTSTIATTNDNEADSGSIIMRHFGEYNNEAAAFENHEVLDTNGSWCMKASDMPKNLAIDGVKHTLPMSSCVSLSTSDVAPTNIKKLEENDTKICTKMVRNVTTMTTDRTNTNNCSTAKLSNSSEIIAKSWAVQYDELSQDQKVLARKAINDILFDGCMGRLTTGLNGRVVNCNLLN